jgi:type VI secretion system secreted protein VgrG
MGGVSSNKLTFTVKWEDSDTDRIDFEVVSFEGREAISEDYEFKLNLRSIDTLKDTSLLGRRATLTIEMNDIDNRGSTKSNYHGMIFEFSSLEKIGHYYYYEATLAPKLAQLKHGRKSDVFINSNLAEILNTVFNGREFADEDRELAFDAENKNYQASKAAYNRYNYVCQYEESDYNFVNRLLERDGLYYYFEQTDESEKLIITDTKDKFLSRKGELYFRYLSDQLSNLDSNAFNTIKCKQTVVANQVTIKNFGYEMAHLGDKGVISCSASVAGPENEGNLAFIGEEIIYGENFINPDNNGDGKFLASIRAQEVFWQNKVFMANSTALPISAGMKVSLKHDTMPEFNREYLVIEVLHSGSQHFSDMEKPVDRPFYENKMVLIPADVQFRPRRKTPWPKIYGTMNALIDGDGQSKYPQIDKNGRYKVRLPFLHKAKADGKSSIWLRLATPYAGNAFGFHFPLHKDTEVVLSFRDGNPDLPVIMGAVFNSLHQNVVINQNAYLGGVLMTHAGNIMAMDDSKGAHSIGFATNNNWQYYQ